MCWTNCVSKPNGQERLRHLCFLMVLSIRFHFLVWADFMAFGSPYCSESALVLVTTEGSCQGLKLSVGPGRVRSACCFSVEQVLSALHILNSPQNRHSWRGTLNCPRIRHPWWCQLSRWARENAGDDGGGGGGGGDYSTKIRVKDYNATKVLRNISPMPQRRQCHRLVRDYPFENNLCRPAVAEGGGGSFPAL